MDGLRRNGGEVTAAEAFAWLRIGGAVVVALAVVLGSPDHGTAFVVALAAASIYAIVLAVLAARGLRKRSRIEISLADVGFVLLLIACSGGALSEARVALVVYPAAMGLGHSARSIAFVTAVAAAGYSAVSLASLDERGAETAYIQTLAAMVIVGAIGVALATAFQRRTRQIEELGSGRAALLHEALDAEERERARIGERLHDDTLQSLLAAQQDVREARAGYLQSLEFADEALTDAVHALRETVLGLHPASLAERGLELGLRVEVDRVARRARLDVELEVDPEAVGPHDALLYAAARELITNVVKHASASRLTVTLAREPEAIVLTVRDDGAGMRVETRSAEALAEGHVGLVSTRQRVGAAGGRLELRSAPGEGTTARVTVPARAVQRPAVAGGDGDPARLEALRATGLLDSRPDDAFDRIARLAGRLLDAPIAGVALVDAERVFLLAGRGVAEPFAARREWPLTHSPCRFVVAGDAPLAVEDARTDPLLRDGTTVSELGIVAYAGAPLGTPAGQAIGTVFVADVRSRAWSPEDLETVHELAQIAGRELVWAERAARGARAGDELDTERRFISAVLENLDEGVIACDEIGELRIVNAAARELGADGPGGLGDLAVRGALRRAATGEAVGQNDLPLDRALRGESIADEEYLAGDRAGERRALILAGRPIDAVDGAGGAIMTIRDVTEQRLAQRASREAEERFRVAFEHAPVGMGIAGLEGRFWSVNLALAELTGLRAELLKRATLESLLHPEDVEGPALGIQALEEDPAAVYVTEKRILHADGHEIWVSLQVAVIRDGAGRPQHLLVQLHDTSERRREEERLRTLADRDELTLLLNRSGFARELRRHAARVERYGTEGGVLLIDVDGMREINAALGRGGGDDILRRFALALEARVRRSDFTARLGEDEFAVLVPHGDADGLMTLAESLLGRLERAQSESAERIGAPVTVSIGVAVFGAGATEADTVLRRATAAKDAAWRAGGGRALLFGPAIMSGPAD
jgi:two-component system NarL family sensor kinase